MPGAWVLDIDLVFGDVLAPLSLVSSSVHTQTAMPFKQGSSDSFTEHYRKLFWRAVSMQRKAYVSSSMAIEGWMKLKVWNESI